MTEIGLIFIAVITIALLPIVVGERKDHEAKHNSFKVEVKTLKAKIREQNLDIKYLSDASKTKDTVIAQRTEEYYKILDINGRLIKVNERLSKLLKQKVKHEKLLSDSRSASVDKSGK